MLGASLAALMCFCAVHASLSPPYRAHYYNNLELSKVLASIEDRLRNLDAISSAQAQQNRRLDVIQDKLERLTLKVESAQMTADRIEHRLNLLHTDIQSSLEKNIHRIESTVENFTKTFNSNRIGIDKELDESIEKIEKSQLRMDSISHNLTYFLEPQRRILEKVSSTYSENFRRGLRLEALVQDSAALVNVTRRELADGVKNLMRKHRDSRVTPANLDNAVNEATSACTKRIEDHATKLDKKIQTVLSAQNSFLDSCHKIQKDEPQLGFVHDVIDRMLDIFINKTDSMLQNLQGLQSVVRTHDAKMQYYFSKQPTGARAGQLSESTLYRVEMFLKNCTACSLKQNELLQMTEKFIALTNRADAALQRLENNFTADDDEGPSEITASADRLYDKLNNIGKEDIEDDETWSEYTGEEDEPLEKDNYADYNYSFEQYKEDKVNKSFARKQHQASIDTAWAMHNKKLKKNLSSKDKKYQYEIKPQSMGEPILKQRKEKSEDNSEDIRRDYYEKFKDQITKRPIHRRHLHKHPYDRGPQKPDNY